MAAVSALAAADIVVSVAVDIVVEQTVDPRTSHCFPVAVVSALVAADIVVVVVLNQAYQRD